MACSDHCQAQGEPLAGSAGAATVWVGISWPKPLWHADTIERSEGLPEAVRALGQEAAQRGEKLALRLFQRAPRPSTREVELVLARPTGEGGQLPSVGIDRVADVIARFVRGERLPSTASPLGRWLFVCTDGRHDACCARLGRPLFEALQRERAAITTQERVEVDVAEVSHLGGHRFAANCLALPSGFLYGRVQPEEARPLLEATARGLCWPTRLRGRLGLAELAQAAEVFGRQSGLLDADLTTGETLVEAETARVRLDAGARGSFWVHCESASFYGPASCGPDAATEARRRWIPRSIRPDPTSPDSQS